MRRLVVTLGVSCLLGFLVGIVVPVILAWRTKRDVAWLMGAYQARFVSEEQPFVRWPGDASAGDGGRQDGPGQPGA